MSFFKKLFKGIIIGAVVGLTGGAALLAMGVTTIGAGAAAIGITLKGAAIYGAVYGGLQGASAAFIKKQRMPTGEVQARTNISVDPQTLGKWIFGETSAGTDVVYSEKVSDTSIVHVIAAAAHEIDSFGALSINDEAITLSGNAATGAWANALSVYRNLGTQTQSALSIPSSSWPTTARGLGIAHYALKWDFDSDNGKTKLSGGIPTRITQVVRGAKVYDPRLDSTRGGSGAHRANDQTTWAWSANWALIVAHYLLGWYSNSKLIYGVGIDPDSIDWPSVADMADVCDTVVDGKAKYRIGGIFAITQDHESIIGQLESAVGGKVSKFGGKYYLWCPHNDLVSSGTLTDADIVADAGIVYTPAGPIETLYNTARGQYVEPSLLYLLQPYPEVTEATAVIEDGKDRVLQQDFPIIQDVEIAQRVARELVRRTRFSGTIKVVVGPKGLLVKPFDVITVNFRETNFTNELFRVISMQYSAGGAIIMELLEEDASIYDVTTPLGTALTQLDPSAYDPSTAYSVSGLSLTNVSVAGSGGTTIDGVRVSWTAPSSFVEFTEGGFRKSGDPDFIYDRTERGATSAVIAPVQPGTLYEFRVRHVSVNGVAGTYATASITTGTTTSVGSAVIANGSITNAKLDANAVAANVFAAGVQPIGIAATVPLTKTVDTIFVTADAKLYRWNGSAYIKTVDDGDITGMTVSKLTAGTINAAITTTNILQLSTDGKIYTAGKTSATSATAGVFLGYDGVSAYDFGVGNSSKSIVWDGSAGSLIVTGDIIATSNVQANAITNAKLSSDAVAANVFAAGVQPIGIAATVPLTKTTDAIFVTSTSKLYRWNGSAYVKTVENDDIVSIVADKITAGTISAAITTTNVLQLSTAGKLYTSGKTSAASTTAGVFLGHDGGTNYDFAVGDGTKSIVWDGSAGTFVITNVNLITSGQMKATGQTTEGLETASIIAAPTATLTNGVYAKTIHNAAALYGENTSGGSGVLGVTSGTGGYGVSGLSTDALLYAMYAFNSAGGLAFRSGGRADFDGDIIMSGATKNLIIGNATNTGQSNLVIKEGVVGSQLANQIQIYGHLSADATTTFGLVTEQVVQSGSFTGSLFTGHSRLLIQVNGAQYYLTLQDV